jgi:hypothetical protein
LPPPTAADRALMGEASMDLWTPHADEPEESSRVDESLEAFAGTRLVRAEAMLPGFRHAVRARLIAAIEDEGHQKRLRAQLEAFADRLRGRWPDAYLVPHQATEEALQLVASGGRAAGMATGRPIINPEQWEDAVASELLDDPGLPLVIERQRWPRPPIPIPPGLGDRIWNDVRLAAGGFMQDENVVAAAEQEETLTATLTIGPPEGGAVVEGGQFHGWRAIATVERRIIKRRDRTENRDLVAMRSRVIEVRSSGNLRALTLPPVAKGDIRWWGVGMGHPFRPSQYPLTGHLIIGLDKTIAAAGDGGRGLGVPTPLLCPTAPLIATLGLQSGEPFILHADDGPCLALVIWRAEYDTSEYYLTRPCLSGAAILMRQSILDRLSVAVEGNLRLRDYVAGEAALALT